MSVWVTWLFASWWLFIAVYDYLRPASKRYKNRRTLYWALVAAGQLAFWGFALLWAWEPIGFVVLIGFGLSWLLWMWEGRRGRQEAPELEMTDTWDFFISYHSEDANVVRRIAERLILGGYRVWFAEYRVLLANYEDFEDEIVQGIKHSSFALLFTTPKYADVV